jgi:hypothetical protein
MSLAVPPAHAQMVSHQTGTTYTFQNTDCDQQGIKAITFSNSSGVAVTLPQAGANNQFLGGCTIQATNVGTGTVTITPVISTINGASSLALTTTQSARIVNDAARANTGNYYALLGAASGSGGAVPTAAILGGAGGTFNPLTLGTNLSLSGNVLNAAGSGGSVPTATALAGVAGSLTPATNISVTSVTTSAGVTDTSPATSIGVSTTGAISWGGTIPGSGSGVVSGSVLNNNVTYNYPTAFTIRNRNLIDTVVANTNSSFIDEGMFLGRQYSGTATIGGEINGYHSFFSDAVGLTFTGPVEQFEASNTINVAHQQVISYLAINHVTTTGSIVGDVDGLVTGLTNDNTTPGSIFQWTGILCKSMSGAGAQPTHSYCLENGDTNQMMVQAGHTVIGKNSIPSATVTAEIFGDNILNSSFALDVVNSALSNLLLVRNSGEVDISTGSLVLGTITGSTQCLQASTTGVVSGTGSACGSSGGAVSSVTNSDGSLTISPTTGAVVASVNQANPFTWTGLHTFNANIVTGASSIVGIGGANPGTAGLFIQGPDGSNSTFALRITAATKNVLLVTDAGSAALLGGLTTGVVGSSAGAINFANATSGLLAIVPPTGALGSHSLILPIPSSTTDTLAVLGTSQTFTATNNFATILEANTTTILANSTVPTVASGFGTSPTIPHGTSTAWFQVNVGTGGTASSGVLTLPAATNGWGCNAVESAANIATLVTRVAPTSVTSVTLSSVSATTGLSTPWPASDVVTLTCTGG